MFDHCFLDAVDVDDCLLIVDDCLLLLLVIVCCFLLFMTVCCLIIVYCLVSAVLPLVLSVLVPALVCAWSCLALVHVGSHLLRFPTCQLICQMLLELCNLLPLRLILLSFHLSLMVVVLLLLVSSCFLLVVGFVVADAVVVVVVIVVGVVVVVLVVVVVVVVGCLSIAPLLFHRWSRVFVV